MGTPSRFCDVYVSTFQPCVLTDSSSLTLTDATRVHIVEPQWNPAMEAQAIAQARRIGQTQAVTVTKYVAEGTVEQVRSPSCAYVATTA